MNPPRFTYPEWLIDMHEILEHLYRFLEWQGYFQEDVPPLDLDAEFLSMWQSQRREQDRPIPGEEPTE